jgi:Bacterial aa3 type cytochrome c oxidase subunit IV
MVDTKHAPHGGYSPDMDGRAHEVTYRGFVRFAEIGTAVVLCWVLALAVGGIKHAWLSAIVGVILSGVAGAIGAISPAIGWRAPAAVGFLLILMLVFY